MSDPRGVGAVLGWFTLDPARDPRPLYRRLYAALRDAIVSGGLAPGTRLPSSRTLAAELEVSRNTVVVAFEMLVAEGFLESRVGDGSYVSLALRRPGARAPAISPAPSRRARRLLDAQPPADAAVARPFAVGVPALDAFPMALWKRALTRAARRLRPEALGFGDPLGQPRLREALARHLATARGVRCDPDQILVVSSSQQALDLAARVLLDPGDAAWVEDPGYPGARGALVGAGAELVPVPVDAAGLDVAEGRRRRPDARLACVTPSHQYPTGVTLSLARRESLLDWADATDAWIVEDDYDSEFRYSGRPLEALQGLARNARVVYVGTFSKVLFPGLRLGWLVAPPALVGAFRAARVLMDGHPAPYPQEVVADLFEEGHFAAHVRRMRRIYRERRDALLAALAPLGPVLRPGDAGAGMHVAAWLEPARDDEALARRGRQHGLELAPLSRYALDEPRRPGLLLGFACAPPGALVEGVGRLAALLESS